MNKFLWGFMTLMAIAIAGYAIALLTITDLSNHGFLADHFLERPVALYGHLLLGSLALIIGPFQFLAGIRSRAPKLHRWLGRSYVCLCLLSAVSSFVLVVNSSAEAARIGFIALGLLWIGSTLQALFKARAKDFASHKDWMIRSYALTYAAVTLRFLLPAQLAAGIPFETAYLVVSWGCWLPNLLFAEWYLRRRRSRSAETVPA